MRYHELVGGTATAFSHNQSKADEISRATKRKADAQVRYSAKMRAAQDSKKLASLNTNPATAAERRQSADQRMNDARGVLSRAVSSANKTINTARGPGF